jgi:hypothetical protein
MEYYSERSRPLLKQRLIVSRQIYFPGIGLRPRCPICEKPILQSADMHEALITRRDVQRHGPYELIFHPCNCVILHHECHMQIAGHGGSVVFEKCAWHLIQWEGIENVGVWLAEMAAVFPVVGSDVLRRFQAIDPLVK